MEDKLIFECLASFLKAYSNYNFDGDQALVLESADLLQKNYPTLEVWLLGKSDTEILKYSETQTFNSFIEVGKRFYEEYYYAYTGMDIDKALYVPMDFLYMAFKKWFKAILSRVYDAQIILKAELEESFVELTKLHTKPQQKEKESTGERKEITEKPYKSHFAKSFSVTKIKGYLCIEEDIDDEIITDAVYTADWSQVLEYVPGRSKKVLGTVCAEYVINLLKRDARQQYREDAAKSIGVETKRLSRATDMPVWWQNKHPNGIVV